MGRSCKTCQHPEREAIEKAILAQVPFRSLSKQFGIGETALFRHGATHIKAKLKKSRMLMEYGSAERLGRMMLRLIRETWELSKQAARYGEYGPAVSAKVAVRGHIETLGKLSGAISNAQSVSVGSGPTMIAVTINYGEDWRGREVEEGEVVAPAPESGNGSKP